MLLIAPGLTLCCCLLQGWHCVVDCSRVDTVLLIPPGVDTVLLIALGLTLCCVIARGLILCCLLQGWHCVVDCSRACIVLLIAPGLTLCC